MSLEAQALITLNPHFFEPEIILQYSQASGAFDTLCDGAPRVRLPEDALAVYIKRLNLRTKMAGGTAAYNELPGVGLVAGYIQAPTYLLQTRSQYDHHDVAAAGRYGFGLPEAYSLGMRQANFEILRVMLLAGFQPQNGEGLLNTPGAVALNLPTDSNGNDTVLTYDNGQWGLFIVQQIGLLKTRTNQLGLGQKFTILAPQRVLEPFEYNVVQITQFQRPGAGTSSSAGLIKSVLLDNGDQIVWSYDDTLIGKGAGGTDAVIITMPEVKKPRGGTINTNVFAGVSPGCDAGTLQYVDMAAPREIVSPMPGGATDVITNWRGTSGWGVRPENVLIISMQYS